MKCQMLECWNSETAVIQHSSIPAFQHFNILPQAVHGPVIASVRPGS